MGATVLLGMKLLQDRRCSLFMNLLDRQYRRR